ncbi:hypothetical protein AC626_24115 [Pseudoalteromonas rubra]|uniref:PEP-CTERM sorting domain-containing protein n=1 Tax=Pseudoalteromonas rubra TaxID=43658 RepID=A0A0L0ELR5_9GAMM|nr:hypothetical protein AC626_24115 [Pseudoalteromonas rubra]
MGMKLSKVASAVSTAGVSAALFSGNIWAAQKTLDFFSGSGTPTTLQDGSNDIPDISLDNAGAVTFLVTAGTVAPLIMIALELWQTLFMAILFPKPVRP